MTKLQQLRQIHARERRALKGRQDYELALSFVSNRDSARRVAHRTGLSVSRVHALRKVWHSNFLPEVVI